jgi:preprotein translocase subunit SecY
MKKLITTFRNIFAIEDLRIRILNTLGFIAIFRLGSYVVLPGVDPNQLQSNAEGIFGLLDTLLGGAFSNASIFGLGIMPYISASIVLQLLTIAVPYFQKLQKEGESGRKKINQYTRVLTIAITAAQSIAFIQTINAEAIVVDPFWFSVSSLFVLTAGTVFCMWLGEKITDKGIGNGISMLIMIGIPLTRSTGGRSFIETIKRCLNFYYRINRPLFYCDGHCNAYPGDQTDTRAICQAGWRHDPIQWSKTIYSIESECCRGYAYYFCPGFDVYSFFGCFHLEGYQ